MPAVPLTTLAGEHRHLASWTQFNLRIAIQQREEIVAFHINRSLSSF